MEKTMGKNSMFGKIESKEHAIKVINHISKVFVILGGISIIGAFIFVGPLFEERVAMSIVGVVYLGLGLLLGKYKRSIIAIVLLLLSLTGVLLASLNLFGILGSTQNGSVPIIGIGLVIASFQAIKATRKHEGK